VKILLKFRNVCLIVLLACFSGSVIAQTAEIDPVRDYHDHCSVCHGETGDGKSHAMAGLVPPPLDFTTIGLESTLDRQRMINAVANGKPGTAMSAWKRLATIRAGCSTPKPVLCVTVMTAMDPHGARTR